MTRLCKICNSPLRRGKLYCSNTCRANDPINKKRVSSQMKGRDITWGDKIGNALRVRELSIEHKQKLKSAHVGMFGKKHSKSTIQKMRIVKLGELNPMFQREVSANTRRKQRVAAIRYMRHIRGTLPTNVGKNETILLNNQSNFVGKEILRQYELPELGYVVDGYCPETNTVYEVYEKHHRQNKRIAIDAHREKEIKNKLKCEFVILWDEK